MKVLVSVIIAILVASCSGWSKGGENAYMDSCKQTGNIDCDCAMKLTKKKYPNESDFNKKGGDDMDLAYEIAEKCYLAN